MSTATANHPVQDPTHLHEHLAKCACALGPLHRLHCFVEDLDAFLAPRFVTTLALLTVLVLIVLSLPG